ncbi:twin-arginine translocation signal domain-containing protein [Natrarchaeobius sp. A-rgal3]|uniref:twin-arginine translocation signal domain-containing protein n=1 Tax=Natrarchaeobius versutus TaxID=1679078 RepID=UPI00350FF536
MSDGDGSDREPTRRSVLRTAVVASGATALAGCLDEDIEITISSDSDDAEASGDASPSTDSGGSSDSTDDSSDDPDFTDDGDVEDPTDGDGADDGGDAGSKDDADDPSEDDDADDEDGAGDDDDAGEDDDTDDEDDAGEDDDADDEDDESKDLELSFSEDRIGFDPSNVQIDEVSGNRWRISSGHVGLLVFDEKENAEKATEVIEQYGFTSICFIGRPDPSMTYWLTDGDAPSASGPVDGGEDCIGIDPSNVQIDEVSGNRWRISSGHVGLLVFDEKENAEKATEVIEQYGFTSICFIGRPDPPMTYWTS